MPTKNESMKKINLQNFHELTENRYLGLLLSSLLVFTLPVSIVFLILSSTSTDSSLIVLLALFAFFFSLWLWNKLLLHYGFFQQANQLKDDNKYEKFLPATLLLFTPALILTVLFIMAAYLNISTIPVLLILWFFVFHAITWSWESILIKTHIFDEPRLIKHIAWVSLLLWLTVTAFLEKPEPVILSNDKYRITKNNAELAEKLPFIISKTRIEATFHKILTDGQTSNIEEAQIASVFVNLDNNDKQHEVFFIHGKHEDCNNNSCDFYIFNTSSANNEREITDTLEQPPLGIIKDITLPVSISDFPLYGWRNITVVHASGEEKTYRYIDGQYQ